MAEAFEFRACIIIEKATGQRAGTITQLRRLIAEISPQSLAHHFFHYFLRGRLLEYANAFAQWAGESLQERALAEHLSNIDAFAFATIEDLRKELLRVIDGYLESFPQPREAIPGEEFYFSEGVLIAFGTGVRARNLAEFLMAIRFIDPASIYYHFYEARARLHKGADDFSKWLTDIDKKDLAARVGSIDLLMHDLEGIRTHLIAEVEEEVKKDMEGFAP